MYQDIVIVSAVRTPFGRYCGALKELDYFDLGALPMKEVLARVNIPGNEVDEVFWGVGDTSVCKDVYTSVAARQTLMSLMYELRRRGGGYALGAICGGLAQADACVIKV